MSSFGRLLEQFYSICSRTNCQLRDHEINYSWYYTSNRSVCNVVYNSEPWRKNGMTSWFLTNLDSVYSPMMDTYVLASSLRTSVTSVVEHFHACPLIKVIVRCASGCLYRSSLGRVDGMLNNGRYIYSILSPMAFIRVFKMLCFIENARKHVVGIVRPFFDTKKFSCVLSYTFFRFLTGKKLVGIDRFLLSSPSYTYTQCFSLIGAKF